MNLLLGIILLISPVTLAQIYVSTSGNDSNNGAIDFPVRSFTRAAQLASNIVYVVDSGSYECDLNALNKDLTILPSPGTPTLPLVVRPVGSFRFRNIAEGRRIIMRYFSFNPASSGETIIRVESGSHVRLEHSRYESYENNAIASVMNSRFLVQNLTLVYAVCPPSGCVEVMGPTSNVSIDDSFLRGISRGVLLQSSQGASVAIVRTRLESISARPIQVSSGSVSVVDSSFWQFDQGCLYGLNYEPEYPLDVAVRGCNFGWHVPPTSTSASQIISVSFARSVLISNSNFTDNYVVAVALRNITSSIAILESRFIRTRSRAIVRAEDCQGSMLVDSSFFDDNGLIDALGGAISVKPSSTPTECPRLNVTISRSVFRNNTGMFGSGIYAEGFSSLSIRNCNFDANTASLQGGAARIAGLGVCKPVIEITDSTFSNQTTNQDAIPPPLPVPDNTSKRHAWVADRNVLVGEVAGSAISLDGPFDRVLISRSTFSNNVARTVSGWADGGAVRIKTTSSSGKIELNDNLFESNTAEATDQCFFTAATATGGALSVTGDSVDVEMSRNTFRSNVAISSLLPGSESSFGGAVFIQASSKLPATSSMVIISDCLFQNNSAQLAGAVVLQQVSARLSNASFELSQSKYPPGAVAIIRSKLVEKFDVDDVSLSAVTFEFTSVEQASSSSTRTPTCNLPDFLLQDSFRMECVGCYIDGNSASSIYGINLGILGGAPFLLNDQTSRDIPLLFIPRMLNPGPEPIVANPSDPGGFGADQYSRPQAILQDTMDGVLVTFPFRLNTPLIACDQIITSDTLLLLSADYNCTWFSPSRVLLTASALPWPMLIAFRDLPLLDEVRVVSFTSVVVQAPRSPALPEVTISAPSTIAACQNLMVSGKFSLVGVFSYQSRWSVLSAAGSPNVASYINSNAAQSNLLIADALWGVSATPRTLIVAYTVSSAVVSVTKNITIIREADPRPAIFVEGPSRRRHYASVELQINARVEVPACLSSRNLSLSRQWSLVPGRALAKPGLFGQGLALFLPAAAMAPGADYVFEFSASVPEVDGLSVTQQVVVSALFTPMTSYSSGHGGLLSRDSSLSFEVTVVDPDNSASNTLYLWDIACGRRGVLLLSPATASPGALPSHVQLPFTGYRCEDDNSCVNLPLGRARSQSVAPRTLAVRNYTMYAYTARDERSLVTPFRIDIRDIEPTVAVRLIPQWISPKPLHYERLAVLATVNGQSTLDDSIFSIEWALLRSGANMLTAAAVTTPLDSKTLYIAFRPNAFAAGDVYTLELTVFNKSSGAVVGRNWLEMPMNEAPSGGSVDVLPLNVTQFDAVSISASGWTDEDDPVRYSYSLVIDDVNGDEIVLSDLVDVRATSVTMMLPGRFALRARVMDVMGSATIVDTIIHVSPSVTQTTQNDALLLLQDALRMGDLRRASGYVVWLLRQANDARTAALSLRQSIATSLDQYASQAALSSTNAVFLLRACELLTGVSAGVDSTVRNAVVDIVVKVVDFAYDNPTFGSSASRLFSARSTEGQRSLGIFAQSLSSAMSALKNSSLEATRMVKLQRSVEKVPLIMSRFILTDEERVVASSLYINIMSFVACGSEAFNISIASGMISLSPTTAPSCDTRGTQFAMSVWANGTFPTPTIVNVSGVLTIIPSTVISLSIVPNGLQSVSYNVTAVFSDGQPPAGLGGSVSGCARFDGTQWSTAGCTARIGTNPTDPVVCQCDQLLSAVTTSTPSTSSTGRVSLTLVFGDFPIVSNPLPASSSPDLATPSGSPSGGSFENASVGGLSVIAIAAIASTAGVITIAVAIAVSVFIYRRRNMALAVMRVRTLASNSVQQR